MANRPIFIPERQGAILVRTERVEFEWFPGMARSQAQKSISSLHAEAKKIFDNARILEISSKSPDELGVQLSAFNLMIQTERRTYSVECAYQGSKVFEKGGPYIDLLDGSSIDAKRDPRLLTSGRLIGFRFFQQEWALEPRTAFYDWLYINALHRKPELAERLLSYCAFSDIAFNPDKSINCQAYAAALYVSLRTRGLLNDARSIDKESYLRAIAGREVSNAHQDTTVQRNLF